MKGLNLRAYKTWKLFGGRVRLTASRSGLSTSVGGRRGRIGVRTDGRTRQRYSIGRGWSIRKG